MRKSEAEKIIFFENVANNFYSFFGFVGIGCLLLVSYSFYKITFPLASSIWNKYKLFIVPIESKKFIDYKFKWAVNSELGYYKVST